MHLQWKILKARFRRSKSKSISLYVPTEKDGKGSALKMFTSTKSQPSQVGATGKDMVFKPKDRRLDMKFGHILKKNSQYLYRKNDRFLSEVSYWKEDFGLLLEQDG